MEQLKEPNRETYVIKDLETKEILRDNIERDEIQAALNSVLEQQKARGVRQDRPSFCLHMK